jgi:hypothetical protein
MFGYFEIRLPASLQTKINKTTDGKEKQGMLGIAIMGFLSASSWSTHETVIVPNRAPIQNLYIFFISHVLIRY